MLPWLAGQGLLALLLACLALYYLVLFPDSNCYGTNAGGDCTLLLWHSVIMVLSLMLLLYYIYIVADFVGQLRARREKDEATLAQMYTIERQEKSVEQSVEWQQQILSESVKEQPSQSPPPTDQGPILNERGLLQQFAQPSYLPEMAPSSPLPYHHSSPPLSPVYYADPRTHFVHPVQILQVDHAQFPHQQQQQVGGGGGHLLLSVLPAAAVAQSEQPHYENQQPPPRPPHKRPPPAPPIDDSAKAHYENAGYLREDEGPPKADSGGDVSKEEKEAETTGTTTAGSAETSRSGGDQSATADEKRKKRVRIFDPGTEGDHSPT